MTQLRPHLDWMLKDLADGVPGTRHVVVLTADGLRMAQHATDDDTADRLAAACAGLQSLSGAIAREFPSGDHRTRLVVIESGGGFFYLMAAGTGAYLAVLADEEVDPGLMGRRMRDLVARIGEHLSSPPRAVANGEGPHEEGPPAEESWAGAPRYEGSSDYGSLSGGLREEEPWIDSPREANPSDYRALREGLRVESSSDRTPAAAVATAATAVLTDGPESGRAGGVA